jgi:diguanylate cyclase (GGDEF)-like protein
MTVPTAAVHDGASPYVLRQRDVFLRTLPFIVVAVAAELSLALPPGPTSNVETAISVALLALTAACFFLPWRTLPPWADLAIPLFYVASTLALILAAGGSSAGVGLVVLLPILWAALNLQLWKSLVVVAAVVAVEFVTAYVPVDLSDSVILRRVVIFLAIGTLVSYSIHDIRTRIERIGAHRELLNTDMVSTIALLNESNRVASIVSALVEKLDGCDSVEEAYVAFDDCSTDMFESGGSISLLNPLTELFEVKCSWLAYQSLQYAFPATQCAALQQGHPYESGIDGPTCEHLRGTAWAHTICYPLKNLRETIGVLTVTVSDEVAPSPTNFRDAEHTRQYALLVSAQISIWMTNFLLRESLRNLSIRDPLTNLFNRRFMIETLDREMNLATRSREPTSVIQLDVDHFKGFNDSYGHEVGDSVLRAVADVMLGIFRESDVPCRSGGEEFTVILPRCSWETAKSRAVLLQERVAKIEITLASGEVPPKPPTLSIGIATSPEHGVFAKDLLRAADIALYAAKSSGRDQIVRASAAPRVAATK